MEPQWIAEREVRLDEARALIAAAAPELADARVAPFSAGWDNVAFLADGRPYAGYALIRGDVAAERDLDDATCAAAAGALGDFLHALHATPVEEMRAGGAPLDELGRLDVETRLPRALAGLDRLAAAGRLSAPEGPRAALLASAPRARTPRADSIVHGDLDARHVLVDGGGAPCGVIDWGDVHVGDPAVDLALAHTFLPPPPAPAREAFLARYGAVDAATWGAARFRALCHALLVLEWAAETGRPRVAATAARGVARAAAE